jgi:hypothetical protein
MNHVSRKGLVTGLGLGLSDAVRDGGNRSSQPSPLDKVDHRRGERIRFVGTTAPCLQPALRAVRTEEASGRRSGTWTQRRPTSRLAQVWSTWLEPLRIQAPPSGVGSLTLGPDTSRGPRSLASPLRCAQPNRGEFREAKKIMPNDLRGLYSSIPKNLAADLGASSPLCGLGAGRVDRDGPDVTVEGSPDRPGRAQDELRDSATLLTSRPIRSKPPAAPSPSGPHRTVGVGLAPPATGAADAGRAWINPRCSYKIRRTSWMASGAFCTPWSDRTTSSEATPSKWALR